jgi:hypothetical protein
VKILGQSKPLYTFMKKIDMILLTIRYNNTGLYFHRGSVYDPPAFPWVKGFSFSFLFLKKVGKILGKSKPLYTFILLSRK